MLEAHDSLVEEAKQDSSNETKGEETEEVALNVQNLMTINGYCRKLFDTMDDMK